ncbi:MAG: RNA polymerase sigma factor [Acutalibacteraceae bacterium]
MTKNHYADPLEAFNSIYNQYYLPIVSYFNKRFDTDEAEDLTQQTFMKLWVYMPNYHFIRNEKSLIFSIAKNVLNDRLRQKKSAFETVSMDSAQFLCRSDDVSSVEMQGIIAGMSARDREIITLKTDGWSSREIAAIQKISPSAVRSRLQVIRKYIDEKLRQSETGK